MKPMLFSPDTDVLSFTERMKSVLSLVQGSGESMTVEGLHGASRAFFLAHLARDFPGPIVVFTADQNTSETLLGDLKYFFRYEKLKRKPRFFPSWELLPYEHLSPLSEISGERLEVLSDLMGGELPFLVVPLEAALQGVMPRSVLQKFSFPLAKGDTLEREILETCLIDNGYSRASLVEDRGEFSIRGDIVDVFLPASLNPVRIEFFGDQIESLRTFDVTSQVSVEEINRVNILPVRELCFAPEDAERVIEEIQAGATGREADRIKIRELVEKIRHLGHFSGIEQLSPFFYTEKENLFDYLPKDTLIVIDEEDQVFAKAEEFYELVQTEYRNARDGGDVVAEPERFYESPENLEALLSAHSRITLNTLKLADPASGNVISFDVKPIPPLRGQFDSLAEHLVRWEEEGLQATLLAPTRGQVRRIHELLNEYGLTLAVDLGYLSAGFQIPCLKNVFVAEHEIFGRTHKHRYRRKPKSQSFQRGFKDLKPGDYLVHVDYGIGQYLGMKELQTGVGGGEFLDILYSDDEKLYVPMESLGYIQKYIGSGEGAPPLSKLGSVSWKRQKSKVKKAIQEMAGDLLKLYARREVATGTSYSVNPVLFQEFADSFEFEETEDQLKAIDDTLEDLEKDKPMDRLICGDVGYGKTEVAMRTAFQVVLEKKQVAVLVPTTVLAQQHLITFRERFRNYPVNINMVNRFRTGREQKDILRKLNQGEVDIIIGTHRLLSKDVEFADLGLIIIDEEQRFGVRHKEALKKLRASVDILTLTATPIPRTLHFSLMGIRDLSVIETPPSDRLAIKTFVRKFEERIVREAILRELDRGGQIFFVHNKVKSIQSVAEMIRRIVPHVRIGIGHGQLPEHQLEEVMKKFIDKEIDLLLCTTIIESGLDIPSANTIIVNRADQFGLAQLYQLRGRVGRYKHQAYAYFLIPGTMAITPEARKRLIAIEEMSELGAGFQLAARDMEIRGVGNMLGHNQSGHIASVGFDLYCKLIEDTVKELRGDKAEARIEPEINLMIKGYIPKDYIPDMSQRLEIYRRIQVLNELDDRGTLEAELIDRFGPLPEPLQKLMALMTTRILCQKIHISRAELKGGEIRLNIESSTPLAPHVIASNLDSRIKFHSEYQVGLKWGNQGWRKDLEWVNGYLQSLVAANEKE